jgi:hypothetical protein
VEESKTKSTSEILAPFRELAFVPAQLFIKGATYTKGKVLRKGKSSKDASAPSEPQTEKSFANEHGAKREQTSQMYSVGTTF